MNAFLSMQDMYKSCRLCLKICETVDLNPIFRATDGSPRDNFSENPVVHDFFFKKLKIKLNDGKPEIVCNVCSDKIEIINKFYTQCVSANEQLEKLMIQKSKADHDTNNCIVEDVGGNKFEMVLAETYVKCDNLNQNYNECIEYEKLDEDFLADVNCINTREIIQTKLENSNQNDCEELEIKVEENDSTVTDIECGLCGEQFNISQNCLIKHIEQEHTEYCNKGAKLSKESLNDCIPCSYETFSTSELANHNQSAHPSSFICQFCFKDSKTRSAHNSHLKLHEDIKYTCNICEHFFKTKSNLTFHKKKVHNIGNLSCSKCDKKFVDGRLLQIHMKSHKPNKRYQCSFCEKSFLQRHHVEDHERKHTGQRPFLCNTCGNRFRTHSALKRHLETHNDKKPATKVQFGCNVCNKMFAHRASYNLHMRNHTGVRPHKCDICDESFALKHYLSSHIRKHTGLKPLTCDKCDSSFTVPSALQWHMQVVHDGPVLLEMFICSICQKKFQSASTLANHIKSHLEERNFVCNDCESSFKSAKHLKIHKENIHLKIKPNQCDLCSKTFYYASQLREHRTIHTGEKPWECEHCDKKFRLLKVYQEHIRIHTGDKPHKCIYCIESFRNSLELRKHANKIHKNEIALVTQDVLVNVTELIEIGSVEVEVEVLDLNV